MTGLSRNLEGKRVALAGFGVVGQGVYDLLMGRGGQFSIVGVLCRTPSRYVSEGAPADLLTDDFNSLPPFDILVEAIGGVEPAGVYAMSAIERGADVVSANKTLFSRRHDTLLAAAKARGVRFAYSAAVGGGVPMLETIDECVAAGGIARIDAVLNGTTNFVLDRIGAGLSTADAVKLAQDAGFAEADPSSDIDGVDAAEKLSLLTRRAFGVGIDPDAITRDRLADISPDDIKAAQDSGSPYKQVASAILVDGGPALRVSLTQVAESNPLSKPRLEENTLVVTLADGTTRVVHGKGAGRLPTALSILADLERLEEDSRAFA